MTNLTLFYKPTCPYSRKVLDYMEEHDIHIPLKSTLEAENRKELVEKGGRQQIPALEVDGQIMYESDAIVAFLKENMS